MEKAVLKSKTILGILITALVSLAPEVGISFSEGDGAFIMDGVDQVIELFGIALATWGRLTAQAKLRFF
jgi:hypothetical protein